MPSSKPLANTVSLDELLCFQLYTTSLRMTHIYKPMLAKLNLTYPQYLVMIVLWQSDRLGIKDVAQRMGQDPGSITPLVKRLVAEGYLVRNRDPDDDRSVILTLSKAGRNLHAAARHVNEAIGQACGLVQTDLARLMDDIRKLNERLSAYES